MSNQSDTEINPNNLFADVNVTMKSGNLVNKPEDVGSGKYVKFRIATNKQYEDKNGDIKTNTNYFNVLISVHLTEVFKRAQGFKKGDWVYIKGEDSTKSFDTPEGYKQTASTIFAYHAVLKKGKDDLIKSHTDQQPENGLEVTPTRNA